MAISEWELKSLEDLQKDVTELLNLLNQLDALKQEEAELRSKLKSAEDVVSEAQDEFYALVQSQQRRANRMRDLIQKPHDELKKIRGYGTGYGALMADRIKALEAEIEGNGLLQKQYSDLLSKPVKMDPKDLAEAQKHIDEIGNRGDRHDREIERLCNLIVSSAVKLERDARAVSRFRGHLFPKCSSDYLKERIHDAETGVYLRR